MKNPITVGGPHGSTLFSERFETCIGAGEEKSFEELIPPHFREDEMLLYWKRESPFGRGDSRSPAKRPFPIETSRGCPNSCNFCMMGSFWGGWKERPLEVLKEYVRWLKEKRGVDELIILDDNVSLKKERFLQILEIFKEEEMRWRAPNGIYLPSIFDVEVIMAIRDSNCTGLSLPFETGVRTTAMEMNLGRKWIDPDDARELVSLLQDIHLTGFFIIGYPGEDEEDVRETLRFANSLPLNERHIYLATPYPGSSLYERVKQAGWLREGEPATYRNALIDTPWLSSKRLLQLFHEDRDMAIRRKEGKDET
jgi:radical SAM superfamily enzyme YgiQ (UPF0313 family)